MKRGGENTNPQSGALIVAHVGRAPAASQPAGARFDVPGSRAWLTAVECADLQLPGCPGERTLQKLIRDGEIVTRKRQGRGGGREFHWTSLPREAREEYLKRHGVQVIENERADNAKSRSAQRDLQAEGRHLIVKAAQAFIADHHLPIGKGLKKFCAAFQRRRTKLDAWVYEITPTLQPHHIRTWERGLRVSGTGALVDKRGRPAGTGLIERDDTLRAFIVSQLAARPQLTAGHLCDAVRVDLGREIALRTMQLFLANFRKENAPILKALTNPDQHRSHHKPAFGSLSAAITRINQRWELDATRADAMCLQADGSLRRCAITGLIDVRTRRAIVLVSDQPRAVATQALLRRAILAWGLPEILKTDNGKEFVARSVTRFCADLGIEVQFSRVFTPEQKGHIERFFGTMNRGLFKLLPGFVGHNIADRKAIESRASFSHRFGEQAQLVIETSLTPAALQARIDAWMADVYEQAVHEGLNAAPAAVAAALSDQVRRIADERALDALLMDAPDASGIRNVGKKGISVGRRWYIAPELGAMMGNRVHVRLDPADDGRIVIYSHDRTRFICIAENVEAIDNARRIQIAREAQAVQRRGLRLVRGDVAEVQKHFPAAGLADRILTDAAGDSFILKPDAQMAMEAARPRLVVAREGLDALDQVKAGPQPQEPSAAERDAAQTYLADMTVRLPETATLLECDGYSRPNFGDDDVAFWMWAEAFKAQGGTPDAQDADLLGELAGSPAFQQQLSTRGKA